MAVAIDRPTTARPRAKRRGRRISAETRTAMLFLAPSFIGSPAMNLFEATVDRRNGHLIATVGDQLLRLPPRRELDALTGRKVALGIRPEHLEDATVATGAPPELRLKAAVRSVEALGAELIAHLEIAGRPVLTDEVKEIAADLDATLVAELEQESRDATLPLVGRFDVHSRARTGDSIEVVVDTDEIHYFDLDSGAAIGRG